MRAGIRDLISCRLAPACVRHPATSPRPLAFRSNGQEITWTTLSWRARGVRRAGRRAARGTDSLARDNQREAGAERRCPAELRRCGARLEWTASVGRMGIRAARRNWAMRARRVDRTACSTMHHIWLASDLQAKPRDIVFYTPVISVNATPLARLLASHRSRHPALPPPKLRNLSSKTSTRVGSASSTDSKLVSFGPARVILFRFVKDPSCPCGSEW